MIIIGMTGPIGHGKSTFAKALMQIEPSSQRIESSMVIGEVANNLHASSKTPPDRDDIDAINVWLRPLPSILLETVHAHCTYEQIKIDAEDAKAHPIDYEKLFLHLENLARKPELSRQNINHDNKEEYRPILQWLGGYLVDKVDPDIWYKEIINRARNLNTRGVGLCIIGGLRYPSDAERVKEAGGKIIKVYRPGHLQYDMQDPTERERDNVTSDATVVSNGGIDDVKNVASQVLTDLRSNQLKKIYYAKPQTA